MTKSEDNYDMIPSTGELFSNDYPLIVALAICYSLTTIHRF